MTDVNRNRIDQWKADVEKSVDFYNDWFLSFAPATFRRERERAAEKVRRLFDLSGACRGINEEFLFAHPDSLAIIRQMLCPPIARDRLAGFANVSRGQVKKFEEKGQDGCSLSASDRVALVKIYRVIRKLLDGELLPWLDGRSEPEPVQLDRSALVIADRLCGALSDPILRNAQESRQLAAISGWLESCGYVRSAERSWRELRPGEFAFRLNVRVDVEERASRTVNIPVDVTVLPKTAGRSDLPVFIEAKSAGDFANVNKRRKEEAQKMRQLRLTYGSGVRFILFLSGYFDGSYLGYEAAEGIDWVWEHRIDDMGRLGL